MAESTKVNYSTDLCMGKVAMSGLMVGVMLETTFATKRKDMGSLHSLTAKFTKGCGKMADNTGKESSSTLIKPKKQGSGIMGKKYQTKLTSQWGLGFGVWGLGFGVW